MKSTSSRPSAQTTTPNTIRDGSMPRLLPAPWLERAWTAHQQQVSRTDCVRLRYPKTAGIMNLLKILHN